MATHAVTTLEHQHVNKRVAPTAPRMFCSLIAFLNQNKKDSDIGELLPESGVCLSQQLILCISSYNVKEEMKCDWLHALTSSQLYFLSHVKKTKQSFSHIELIIPDNAYLGLLHSCMLFN